MIIRKTETNYTYKGMLFKQRIIYWFLFIPIYSVSIDVKNEDGLRRLKDGLRR